MVLHYSNLCIKYSAAMEIQQRTLANWKNTFHDLAEWFCNNVNKEGSWVEEVTAKEGSPQYRLLPVTLTTYKRRAKIVSKYRTNVV